MHSIVAHDSTTILNVSYCAKLEAICKGSSKFSEFMKVGLWLTESYKHKRAWYWVSGSFDLSAFKMICNI